MVQILSTKRGFITRCARSAPEAWKNFQKTQSERTPHFCRVGDFYSLLFRWGYFDVFAKRERKLFDGSEDRRCVVSNTNRKS